MEGLLGRDVDVDEKDAAERGELTKGEDVCEEDVDVLVYTLGEMTIPSLSSGNSFPTGDPVINVGVYILGEIGPSNFERSK